MQTISPRYRVARISAIDQLSPAGSAVQAEEGERPADEPSSLVLLPLTMHGG